VGGEDREVSVVRREFDLGLRAGVLGLWWGVLTGWVAGSWLVGVPVVVVATAVSWVLMPRLSWRWGWRGALRFGWGFLWGSLRGGIDVARRALHPRMPLRPGLVRLVLKLPEGGARVFLALVVSLLPGTLSVRLEGDELVVHGLDVGMGVEGEVRKVERLVARMLLVELGLASGEGQSGKEEA
jgi:multicomponent Na+:H+ antiporter subunit E